MFSNFYIKAKNWFLHSESIFWARLQIVAGVAWGVLSVSDLSPLLSPKWFAVWGIVNGLISEILRRRYTTTETYMVPQVGATELVPVTTLVSTPVTKL